MSVRIHSVCLVVLLGISLYLPCKAFHSSSDLKRPARAAEGDLTPHPHPQGEKKVKFFDCVIMWRGSFPAMTVSVLIASASSLPTHYLNLQRFLLLFHRACFLWASPHCPQCQIFISVSGLLLMRMVPTGVGIGTRVSKGGAVWGGCGSFQREAWLAMIGALWESMALETSSQDCFLLLMCLLMFALPYTFVWIGVNGHPGIFTAYNLVC